MRAFVLTSLIAGVAAAASPKIPSGVKYVTAPPEVNATARATLAAMFTGAPPTLNVKVPEKGVVMLGPFLGQRLAPLDMSGFLKVTAKIPFGNTMADMQSYGSRTPDESRALLALLRDFAPTPPVKIRPMTPQEMKLIWPFIAWDITEPVFIVESKDRKWVVSLDPTGTTPAWLEDLTSPCFTAAELAGKCLCATVEPAGRDWRVVYAEKKACADATAPQPKPVDADLAELRLVQLLQPEDVIGARITVEGLAGYSKRLLAAVIGALPSKTGTAAGVTLTVGVKEDGSRVWVTPAKKTPLPAATMSALVQAVRAVEAPAATGLVVFQLHLQLWGGPPFEREQFEESPFEWRAVMKDQKDPVDVETVVLKAWKQP